MLRIIDNLDFRIGIIFNVKSLSSQNTYSVCRLKQTLLRYVRLMSSQFRRRLSVSVTLVLPTQKVGHVNNIFAPSNSSRNRTFCVKI